MVNVWSSGYTYSGRFRQIFPLPPVIAPEGRLLDWGCSYGRTSSDISFTYPERMVLGVDIDSFRIRLAKCTSLHGRLQFFAEDGFDFLRRGEKFGAIFALNNVLPGFIEGEPKPSDIRELGLLMRESLVSKGLLVVSAGKSHDDRQHHVFAYRQGKGLVLEPILEDVVENPDTSRLREFKELFF